jgi:hypothetical protein
MICEFDEVVLAPFQPSQRPPNSTTFLQTSPPILFYLFQDQPTKQHHQPIPSQPMHIERNNSDTISFLSINNQMRTAKNHEKLHRNYRSQIREKAQEHRAP